MAQHKNDSKSDVGVVERDEHQVQKPRKYKAVMLNDDFTPMDVVTAILMQFFLKDIAEATRLMLEVHDKGRGVIGVYSKEICETKCTNAVSFASALGHPFLVEAEPE